MKGLIIKDLINLKKYGWSVLMVAGLYVLFSLTLDDPEFMGGMVVLMFSMIVVTSFSYDNMSGWDKYVISMPVSRKTVVKSKYALALLLSLLGALLSAVIGIVMGIINGTADVTEQLLISAALLGVGILFLSIMLPLIFKFGVEKSRILVIIVFAIPFAVIFALSQSGMTLPSQDQVMRILAYSPLMLAALFVFSYMLSCYFYSTKEV